MGFYCERCRARLREEDWVPLCEDLRNVCRWCDFRTAVERYLRWCAKTGTEFAAEEMWDRMRKKVGKDGWRV